MKTIKYVFLTAIVLLTASCTLRYTPNIYNVNNATVVTKSKQPTLTQVGNAISVAGAGLGWAMKPVRSGYTIGILELRNHQAKVGITYTTKVYSINYISSVNLTRNGQIHQNYNSWVQNLNNAIKRQLAIV